MINFAAYSTPREVYGKIIPAFQSVWKEAHDDQSVIFQASYGGSTTQAQNVVNGFPADVVALSLDPDVQLIQDAGLITHDWKTGSRRWHGRRRPPSCSTFGRATRWASRTGTTSPKPGVEILTPDPASERRRTVELRRRLGRRDARRRSGYVPNDDEPPRQSLLNGIFSNVTRDGQERRDSIQNFEAGNGDVAITYEYEVQPRRRPDSRTRWSIPPSTVADPEPGLGRRRERGRRTASQDVANAFVEFLHSDERRSST